MILFNWSKSLYSKLIFPLFLLLFLISTFKPILFEMDNSRAIMFVSLIILDLGLLFLNNLTKFSACLTESFFSTIFDATKLEFSRPTKIFAWPEVIFLLSIKKDLNNSLNITTDFIIHQSS